MSVKKFQVEKEFIIAAHKEANSEWKAKLEKQFPELFDSGRFKFTQKIVVGLDRNSTAPFVVGYGAVPDVYENQCLLVDSTYKAEIVTEGGKQLITFTKK